ncbi:RelA/SpoT family protein [Scytonema sp. UIC 10036]|nr:RelA/SpoT family protein [Scytonema sp. UIC 10036]
MDIPQIDVTIPEWLEKYLTEASSTTNEPVDDNTALIARAFIFAYQLYQGQYRRSGEPYIGHPVAVAGILRDLGGSPAMIAAGLLHDVVEDTNVTIEEIEQRFGIEVRQLVEGVTKLSKINFKSKTESQAENIRRMFLSMAQDIRIIVVKLADRLHNMRTLEHLPEDKRKIIALETREIFAPLANRLGIWQIKWELEDCSFKYLEPESYREIQEYVAEKRGAREKRLASVAETLRNRLVEAGIKCLDIIGHPKHLYSIFQKMQRQNKEFHEIYDLDTLRIIVNTNEECYRAVAIVHDAFRPIPGRFKDYIGLPKPNRYQSLHTGVISPWARPLEVQIRTLEMHRIAEYENAAEWEYLETGSLSSLSKTMPTAIYEKFTWLRQLLEWRNYLNDAQEYFIPVSWNLGNERYLRPQTYLVNIQIEALDRVGVLKDILSRLGEQGIVARHAQVKTTNAQLALIDLGIEIPDTSQLEEIFTQIKKLSDFLIVRRLGLENYNDIVG